MRNRLAGLLGFVMALALVAVPASAVPITGLFNTGQNVAGGIDQAWTLTQAPGGVLNLPSAYVQTAIPSVWTPGTWIGPSNGDGTTGTGTDPGGLYVYTLTFDLTGLDPLTAAISGSWATDNNSTIYVNGIATTFTTGFASFGSLSNFLINSGFVNGVNTIEFYVTNGPQLTGNPTGLLVSNIQGTAEAVPEPGTLLLIGTGLTGLALRRRRRG